MNNCVTVSPVYWIVDNSYHNLCSTFGTDLQSQFVHITQNWKVSRINVTQLKVTVSTLSGDNFISHGKCLSFFPLPMAIPCIIVPEMWQCCNKIYALPLQILFLGKYINILPNTKHSIPNVFLLHSHCFKGIQTSQTKVTVGPCTF